MTTTMTLVIPFNPKIGFSYRPLDSALSYVVLGQHHLEHHR